MLQGRSLCFLRLNARGFERSGDVADFRYGGGFDGDCYWRHRFLRDADFSAFEDGDERGYGFWVEAFIG